jgi:hypothetical protein
MSSASTEITSCFFPLSSSASNAQKRPLSVRVELQQPMLVQQLVEKEQESNSRLIAAAQVTWALLLRIYTGLDRICFSYEETGGASHTTLEKGLSDGIAENVVVMDIDEELPLRRLLESAATNVPTADRECQYNTSVLVRFGSQMGNTHSIAKPMVMPATVR